MKGKMSKSEARERVMIILTIDHKGKENTIGMGELFEKVYDETWSHRINDTRPLRKTIESLRDDGVPIGENRSSNNGGYFLARTPSELTDYCDRIKSACLKRLARVARMQKTALPEMLGQMSLNMNGKMEKTA